MYKPLPACLTIKKSPIEGLGLYATKDIKANSFIGLTHIQDEDFENGYTKHVKRSDTGKYNLALLYFLFFFVAFSPSNIFLSSELTN